MRLLPQLALACATFLTAAGAAPQITDPKPGIEQICPNAGAVPSGFASAVSASSFRAVDGSEIRLAGVIGSGEDGTESSLEQSAAARAALGSMLAGHRLSLAIIGSPDRYGRINAQVFADGEWVQDRMLRQGLLRVAPDRPAAGCLLSMVASEDAAISEKTGHWADGRYRVMTPDQVTKSSGRFETVEGEVWRTRLLKGKETIEFTNASSFQAVIPPQAARVLRGTGIDVRRLRGRTVRVRGWIGFDDRPAMEISTPEGLEVIGRLPRPRK
jgi:endonuclease YncB( thermonuclease family)